jgi:tetratricopeptide (TPR) repeat protein
MHDLKLGQMLAERFVLSERFPHSDDGESWLARDEESGLDVLLKVAPAVAGDHQRVVARLKELANLTHPALHCAIESVWLEGNHLQVRPWLAGSTSLSLEPGNLDVVLRIAIRITEGLHHAHQQGVFHGNLRPGNVLVDSRGAPHLVDACIGPSGLPGACTNDDYVSPECKAGSAIGAVTDIYSIGALTYRWLTGQDPGRPLPGPQRHDDLIKASRSDDALPGLLISLVVDCLSADPEQRPATILEVRERLEDARLALNRARETGIADSELEWQPPTDRPAVVIPSDQESGNRQIAPARLMFGVALGVIAILLVGVLVILPQQVEQEREAKRAAAAALAQQQALQQSREKARLEAASKPKELSAAELENLLVAKKAAEETLDAFINLQFELKEKQIERWALERFDAAGVLAKTGDDPFRKQLFHQANEIYQLALMALRQIDAQSQLVLVEALQQGLIALDAGDSKSAADAFSLAVALDPENELALLGEKRAASLDQVWALLQQAREFDRAQGWVQAQAHYQQIHALDPDTIGVKSALTRIANTLAEINFRQAMSAGLAALEQGSWDQARKAFGTASKLRPKARGPADGMVEVDRRFREAEIQYHRLEALARQADEQWADALRHFEAVLAHDPNLSFAKQGEQQASDRLELEGKLHQYLAQPERWWSERGRQEATSLLYDAKAVEGNWPRLTIQVEQLVKQLELAERPVTVRLVSDSSCNVVVYKIGRLGSFTSHELSLRPGRYTAVGTRDGYRDVRRDFMVHTNRAPEPVIVRCNEKV